jgi:carbon storage regulator
MLVLTRRPGEQLVIAGNVHITVLAIEGNKVRLGVEAPMSVRVDREEIHRRRLADAESVAAEFDLGSPVG